MAVLRDAALLLHLMGFASLLGGYLVQLNAGARVNSAMAAGAPVVLVTGVALVVLAELRPGAGDDRVDLTKDIVLGVVALVTTVLTAANRRREKVPIGLFHIIGLLALASTVITVFWH